MKLIVIRFSKMLSETGGDLVYKRKKKVDDILFLCMWIGWK